jgi:hypothetical protein
MIIINENRRTWEVNHKVLADGNNLIVHIDDVNEMFDLSGVTDGEDYYLKDSVSLPYNPIRQIIKIGADIIVEVFYDDPHTREGFKDPFKRIKKEIAVIPTKDNDLQLAKDYQNELIGLAFDEEFVTGYFHSDVLDIDVDYRRYDKKNDMQNVEALISFMTDNNIPQTTYKGYASQKATATLEQLKTLLKEMQAHGVLLYNKKDTLRTLINSKTTIAEVKAIVW